MLAGAFSGIKHSTEVDFLRIFVFTPGTISWCGRSGWSFMKTAEGLVGRCRTSRVDGRDVRYGEVLSYIREVTFGPGQKTLGPGPDDLGLFGFKVRK